MMEGNPDLGDSRLVGAENLRILCRLLRELNEQLTGGVDFDKSLGQSSRSIPDGFKAIRKFLTGGQGAVSGITCIKPYGLPTTEPRSFSSLNGSNSITRNNRQASKELSYLLICHSQSRYATRLLQLDLTALATESDRNLFFQLRKHYYRAKGRWVSWLSLRTISSIKFVFFELYRSELVDVRKEDAVPAPQDREYRFRPAPPDIVPPVGSNYLTHLFSHPECAEEEPLCLSRFPKKLKEKLSCKGGIEPGWGLQIVEGWHVKRIWWVVFFMLGSGSLGIAVLWSVFGHNVQDAFAIAGYVVAFGAASLGSLQALLVT